jgi:hypothetical protein
LKESMKRLLLGMALAVPCVFFVPPVGAATAPVTAASAFPLTNHSWWEYGGTAKFGGNPGAQPVRIRMEVIEIIDRPTMRVAWLRGSPLGLMDDSPGTGEQVIAHVGKRIYIAQSARTVEIRQRMRNTDDDLTGLFHESELLFEAPLSSPGTGAWKVSLSATTDKQEYELTRKEPAGFSLIRFTPGVGITGFAFENRASRESANVRLVDSDIRP